MGIVVLCSSPARKSGVCTSGAWLHRIRIADCVSTSSKLTGCGQGGTAAAHASLAFPTGVQLCTEVVAQNARNG